MFESLEPSWANLFGAAALTGACIWPLFRTRKSLLAAQLATNALWSSHFALLGAHTAALVCLIIIVQTVAAYSERRGRLLKIVFILTLPAALLVSLVSWAGLTSVLSSLALVSATFARWQMDLIRMRVGYLAAIALWLVHNILVQSPFGVVAEAITGISNGLRLHELLRLRRIPPQALPD